MKCEFCGLSFETSECRNGCSGCPMSSSCKKIKCPNCNYEMYPDPEFGALKKLMESLKSMFVKEMPPSIAKEAASGAAELYNKYGIPLSLLKVNDRAKVTGIDTKDTRKLRKLAAFGIMPGMDVVVMQKYPAIIIQAGYTQLALDEDIAGEILVTLN